MMYYLKKLFKDNKNEVISFMLISLIFVVFSFLYFGKNIDFYMDCGREFYFSHEMLNGKILYKDIFNLYTPFSYMFNAILLKIFGDNFKTFYVAGCVNAYLIVILSYVIFLKFTKNSIATAFTIFIVTCLCFSTDLMNFIIPYGYSIVYGLSFALIAVLLFFNYSKTKNIKSLYLSFLSLGLMISCKLDYVLIIPAFLFIAILKKEKFLNILISAILSIIPISVLFLILFFQGLTLTDLTAYFSDMLNFVTSKEFKSFYDGYAYFNMDVFIHSLTRLLILSVFFTLSILLAKYFEYSASMKKTVYTVITIVFLFFCASHYYAIARYWFSGFVYLLSLLLLFKIKNFPKNKNLFIFAIFSIMISMKCFWGLRFIYSFGVYFAFYVIFCAYVLIRDFYLKDDFKKIFDNIVLIFLLTLTISGLDTNIFYLKSYNNHIETDKGIVYIDNLQKSLMKDTYEYLKKESSPSDTLIFLPETFTMNYILNLKSDGYYGSLNPMTVEALTPLRCVESYKKTMPDWFVLVEKQVSSAYFDVPAEILSFIEDNYDLKFKKQDALIIVRIYKLKK